MSQGKIRIISGCWRGRKLRVADRPGLRPTTDRLRETLFNWLAPWLVDARCLDLFAGSGALGLEAASRGAGEVLLVEKDRLTAAVLEDQLRQLDAPQVNLFVMDALNFLRRQQRRFDIVFLDPPFGSNLIQPCCELLQKHKRLKHGALVYIEMERTLAASDGLTLPAGWEIIRRTESHEAGAYLVSTDAA